MTTTTATTNQPVVFILDNVSGFETMAEGLYAGYEVHILSADGDALAEMASILDGRTGIEAVHLVSHGEAGELSLGSVALNIGNLADHASSLATIQAALSPDADFLIYGCDVAQGEVGEAFVAALADATGADVAASNDVTGQADDGGDAELEVTTGSIEAAALDADTFQTNLGADAQLPSTLSTNPYTFSASDFQIRVDATISDTDIANAYSSGMNVDQYALNNVADGTLVSVYMGNSSTVDDVLQIVRNGSVLVFDDDMGDGERSYDAFLSWAYQAGDILQATTYQPGERGSYSMFIGTDTGVVPIATIQNGASQITNVGPVFSAIEDGAGAGLASSTGSLSGTLTVANPGSLDLSGLTFSVDGPATNDDGSGLFVAGQYGSLYLDSATGYYSYAPSANAIDALGDNQTGLDTFTFNAVGVSGDVTSGSFSFSVTGTNDAPVVVMEAANGTLDEAGGLNNADQGRTTASIALQISDAEGSGSIDAAAMQAEGWVLSGDETHWTLVGQYGSAELNVGNATVAYALDNSSTATQTLTDGESLSESFVVHVRDADGVTAQASATFSIVGSDDAAVLSVAADAMAETFIDGNGVEQTNYTLNGSVALADFDTDLLSYGNVNYVVAGGSLDDGNNSFKTGGFGFLVINGESGEFSYVGNAQSQAAVAEGEIAYDVFSITMSNGSGLLGTGTIEVQIVGVFQDLP